MTTNLLVFAIFAAALAYASTRLVKSLTRVAVKLRISEFLASFVLMAVGTSLPELIVGLIAALEGDPILSLGNVVGSNIADLSIIIGLPVLLAGGVAFHQSHIRKEELIYMNLSAVAPLILLMDGSLTRFEGAVLLLFFVLYMYNLIFHSKAYHRVFHNHKETRSLGRELLTLAFWLLLLLVSADAMVRSGHSLATAIGIPEILIGLVIIALGTSLPELAFSFSAVKQRHPDLLFGDVMGSVVTNATLILGLTAVISPIHLDGATSFYSSAAVLLITLVYFTALARSGKFAVRDALIMVLGYLLFAILATFSGILR